MPAGTKKNTILTSALDSFLKGGTPRGTMEEGAGSCEYAFAAGPEYQLALVT